MDLPLESSESRSSSEGKGSQSEYIAILTCATNRINISTIVSFWPVLLRCGGIDSGDKNQNIHIISDTIVVPSSGAQVKSSPTLNKSKNQQQSSATITTAMAEQQSTPPSQPQQPSVHVPPGENYSYVQLTAVHDYNYPVVDEPIGCIIRNTREDSPNSIKKRNPADVFAPTLKETHTAKTRMRCRYAAMPSNLPKKQCQSAIGILIKYSLLTRFIQCVQVLPWILYGRIQSTRSMRIRTRLFQKLSRTNDWYEMCSMHALPLHEWFRRWNAAASVRMCVGNWLHKTVSYSYFLFVILKADQLKWNCIFSKFFFSSKTVGLD